ncbi:MAG TPA: T9SS type A sorting domain-containing protein [Flavobacteriales bacterium]|nr:T9SS type A sorting domain-containing protein [Flavobacteriales bacterium]HIA13155.1 T9SS type A sorting domain-containing protein [Flavobacteriales bacterium]
MKRKYIILTLLFAWSTLAFSQDTTFRWVYGTSGYDYARDVQQTFDGGYIIVGSTGGGGSGNSDIYLVKVDSVGIYQWSKAIGGEELEWGYSLEQTADSGYIIAGYTNSYGAGTYDVYVVKTDPVGDTLWTRTFGGSDWDIGYGVAQTNDGGYVIVGETYSFGAGDNDVYVIKLDNLGDSLWTKTIGGAKQESGKEIHQTVDSGYVLVGETSSMGLGKKDLYLVKLDMSGSTVWAQTYGDSLDDVGMSVKQTADTGFIVAGYTKSYNPGYDDFYLIKTDPLGAATWTKTEGAMDDKRAHSIVPTFTGEYAFTGLTTGLGNEDVLFWKVNSTGGFAGAATYGAPIIAESEIGYSIEQTADSGFVVVGTTFSYGAGYSDIYLIKSGPDGTTADTVTYRYEDTSLPPIIIGILEKESSGSSILVYPHPVAAQSRVEVNVQNMKISNFDFELYDHVGRQVIARRSIAGDHYIFSRGNLPAGMYFYKIQASAYGLSKQELYVESGKILIANP